jgi:hypothetical protein
VRSGLDVFEGEPSRRGRRVAEERSARRSKSLKVSVQVLDADFRDLLPVLLPVRKAGAVVGKKEAPPAGFEAADRHSRKLQAWRGLAQIRECCRPVRVCRGGYPRVAEYRAVPRHRGKRVAKNAHKLLWRGGRPSRASMRFHPTSVRSVRRDRSGPCGPPRSCSSFRSR